MDINGTRLFKVICYIKPKREFRWRGTDIAMARLSLLGPFALIVLIINRISVDELIVLTYLQKSTFSTIPLQIRF